MIRIGVDILIEKIPNETIKEQVKARINELEDALSKATDACISGKIIQSFGPIMAAFNMMRLSGN